MITVAEKNGSLVFNVCVVPRSSQSEIVGEHYGALKIRLTSPPVEGAANAELVKLLAKKFAVAKSDVEIVTGETSKRKTVKITNLSRSKFEEAIR